MAVRLKPLSRQCIVITGASSGIGLATARMAAGKGASVLLVSRNETALREAVEDIRARGGRADFAVADVADRSALEAAADRAEERFGGIDAWVNDAGTSIIGRLQETPIEDQRRLFETNYWGVVNGSLVAAERLARRGAGGGGAIINLGSIISDRALIYQGTYSATKHAVKGFTDTLRMELEAARAPISVTLIKPAGIDTPFQEHVPTRLAAPGVRVPPPAYDPRLVARAILYACEHPKREMIIGGLGAITTVMGRLFPRATDRLMELTGEAAQTTRHAGRPGWRDNLYQPRADGTERSSLPGMPHRRTSLLLEAQMHPMATLAVVAGIGALAAGLVAGPRIAHAMPPVRRSVPRRHAPGWRDMRVQGQRLAERLFG
jgi:short-subunit dehydrogenase